MEKKLKHWIQEITPPLFYRAASRWKKAWKERGKERGVDYYDTLYENSNEYSKHFTQSIYYFLWTVVSDRLRFGDSEPILELGCGSGQFASLLSFQGVKNYAGIDLSSVSIGLARDACPDFTFIASDALKEVLLQEMEYRTVIALEILEHIEADLALLERIPPGRRVLASVPSFPHPAHVRCFQNSEQVRNRYERFFVSLRVDTLLMGPKGARFFLLDGQKS